MKHIFTTFLIVIGLNSWSQIDYSNDTAYIFSTITEVTTTSVKDQHRSGTCWSFAATSFVETELLRKNHQNYDLSEMYFVRDAYEEKAINYVQMHGKANFSAGGQAHDVINTIRKKGFVPEKDYPGLRYGQKKHNHSSLDALLSAEVEAVAKNRSGQLNPHWMEVIRATLDAYLGKVPQKIIVEGMTYTPLEWANALDFNPDDYVEITSYTHHPYYEPFRLEIPDNWTYDNYFNVPLEDLMHIIYHALQQGYSVCWDGDVSDKGFSHNHGVAIVPEDELTDMTGTEKTRWQELTEKEKQERLYSFDKPVKEKSITREMRQKAFMNHSATDDHLMHLTGIVQDQHGTWYYKTKNSWNDDSNDFGGYLNMSASFVKLNTIAIMVHKEALPKRIRKKLDL